MLYSIFAFIGLVLAVPDLAVQWAAKSHQEINISVGATDGRLQSCLNSGFDIRYRFEIKLCSTRANLLIDCRAPVILIRTLEYDPISESYRVTSDFLSDEEEPESFIASSREEGLNSMASIRQMPLVSLGWGKDPKQQFVNVRLTSDCKGEYNETLARIGYFLSLGIVRFNEHTTGWISFALR